MTATTSSSKPALAATFCLLFTFFATAQAETAPAGGTPYVISPGDVLQISVWKEPDLEREVLVNPDGHLAFPLAGDVVASGRSVEQLRQELTEKLSRYIPDVVVTVATKQLNGNKVYVLGQVNRPGEFTMARSIDVMQALGMAGGPNTFADLDDIKILRRDAQGSQTAIPFEYGAVQNGRRLEQNIVLQSGDTVVVP